jgi:hypothetical protein
MVLQLCLQVGQHIVCLGPAIAHVLAIGRYCILTSQPLERIQTAAGTGAGGCEGRPPKLAHRRKQAATTTAFIS